MALSLLITTNNKIPIIIYCEKLFRLTIFSIGNKRTYIQKTPGKDSEIKLNIDEFTSNLIREKCLKWNSYKLNDRHEPLNLESNKNTLNLDIKKLDQQQLHYFIKKCTENNDFKTCSLIINQILDYKYVVPYYILNCLLTSSTKEGDVKNIKALISLHNDNLTESQLQYCNFFLAEAKWIRGNVEESLELFQHLYKTVSILQNKIRSLIGYLIAITLEKKTEATLIQILKFCNNLCTEFNDYSFLIALWQTCFLSEWHSDQVLALNLLENNENLRKKITPNIIYIVGNALKLHKIQVVQRLFEVLLKLEMKTDYINVMELLFDYHCLNKNFRRCYEIIQWSLFLETPLRSDQYERYLELFVKESTNKYKNYKFSKMKPTPEFQFKF